MHLLSVSTHCHAQALLHASIGDADEASRAAAHLALAEAPVTAISLKRLLSIEQPTAAPAPTPAKKARAATATAAKAAAQKDVAAGGSLDDCIAVLELLQWKADVQDGAQLLGPLSALLPRLLAVAGEPAPADNPDDDAPSRWALRPCQAYAGEVPRSYCFLSTTCLHQG